MNIVSKSQAPSDLQAMIVTGESAAKTRDKQAEKIIWSAVVASAIGGGLPVGIGILPFIAANITMIVALGHHYGYTMAREQAGALIRHIFTALGLTVAVGILGTKLFVEIFKVLGIATLGGAYAVAMPLDCALMGGLAYALGYTSMTYFKDGCKLDNKQVREQFRRLMEEGKAKVSDEVKKKVAGKA